MLFYFIDSFHIVLVYSYSFYVNIILKYHHIGFIKFMLTNFFSTTFVFVKFIKFVLIKLKNFIRLTLFISTFK